MSTKTKKVTESNAEQALAEVAKWMGKLGYGEAPGEPAPTGPDAAYRGLGPELKMDWDWPGQPTPTILLEGGPEDWAVRVAGNTAFVAAMKALGIFAEPYAGYALCLYPYDF
jgi:hypothetical protein